MRLARKGAHRGVVSIESTAIMITFVIVAAALAFVVLNMGFTTTQKAKTSIISGLGEASSSLQIAGKVIGAGDIAAKKLDAFAVPLKIVSGGESINLEQTTAAVKYLSNSITFDNIYAGTLSSTTYNNLDAGLDAAVTATYITSNPINGGSSPATTQAVVYWTVNSNNNDILDEGEHAVLVIAYAAADRPSALDKVKAEILLPTGAALSVERQVPSITNTIVSLGPSE